MENGRDLEEERIVFAKGIKYPQLRREAYRELERAREPYNCPVSMRHSDSGSFSLRRAEEVCATLRSYSPYFGKEERSEVVALLLKLRETRKKVKIVEGWRKND